MKTSPETHEIQGFSRGTGGTIFGVFIPMISGFSPLAFDSANYTRGGCMADYKFLFINTVDPFKGKVKYPPLGIGYLISSLRKKYGEHLIEFKVIQSKIEREITKFKPDIVGISCLSPNYGLAIEYAKTVKKYALPVIIGGVHISMLPSSMTRDMDVGVIGEGEETICDLFGLFKDEGGFDRGKLRDINGIVYREKNNKLHITSKRLPIEPLDNVPFPARDVLEIDSNTYIFTSRGCPYRCVFCSSSRFWDKVRFFSADYVVNEIELLVDRYGVNHIEVFDDLFILKKKRIESILRLLKERDLHGKVSFYCNARVNLITDEMVKLLEELRVNTIYLGFESGSDKILKYLKGGTMSVEDNENAIEAINKHKIEIQGSFIIGSPEESKRDALETLDFIKRNRLYNCSIYPLTPFPGTPIWEYAKSKNLVSEKMNWDNLRLESFFYNPASAIILSEYLTKEDIQDLSRLCRRMRRPSKIFRLIKKGMRHPLKIPRFIMWRIWNHGYQANRCKIIR